jgi:hypothetical protein
MLHRSVLVATHNARILAPIVAGGIARDPADHPLADFVAKIFVPAGLTVTPLPHVHRPDQRGSWQI